MVGLGGNVAGKRDNKMLEDCFAEGAHQGEKSGQNQHGRQAGINRGIKAGVVVKQSQNQDQRIKQVQHKVYKKKKLACMQS